MPDDAIQPGATAFTRTPDVRPLHRRGLREAHHAGARRARVSHARHAAPHVGDDVDDRAAVLGHPLRVALARAEEAAGQVGADDGLPALLGDAGQRRRELAARIVHQPVDAAGACQRLRHHRLHLRLLADVAGDGVRRRRRGDLAAHRLEALGLAPDQHDRRPQARQLVRRTAPDAAPASGDDVGLAGEEIGPEDRVEPHVAQTLA